jgi:hypothetical protein
MVSLTAIYAHGDNTNSIHIRDAVTAKWAAPGVERQRSTCYYRAWFSAEDRKPWLDC